MERGIPVGVVCDRLHMLVLIVGREARSTRFVLFLIRRIVASLESSTAAALVGTVGIPAEADPIQLSKSLSRHGTLLALEELAISIALTVHPC